LVAAVQLWKVVETRDERARVRSTV
jgi:hypothetical protein